MLNNIRPIGPFSVSLSLPPPQRKKMFFTFYGDCQIGDNSIQLAAKKERKEEVVVETRRERQTKSRKKTNEILRRL
jgi:hypothetical protein